jgi:hypothetical protein
LGEEELAWCKTGVGEGSIGVISGRNAILKAWLLLNWKFVIFPYKLSDKM